MTKLIVLDPGHGGMDPGALGNGLVEKDITLDLARRVQKKLAGVTDVVLTRNSDVFVSLADRADRANKLNADLFVSLHVNSGGGTGFESYVYTEADTGTVEIKNIVHNETAAYYSRFGFPDRGKKKADFAVLRLTKMPAVLLENLFIDTKNDAEKLKDPVFLDGAAEAISRGIIEAVGEQTVPQPQPPAPPSPHWAVMDFERLQKAGLVLDEHNLDSSVTWGEMSAVVARLLDKLNL